MGVAERFKKLPDFLGVQEDRRFLIRPLSVVGANQK